jgi:hypothetical protein
MTNGREPIEQNDEAGVAEEADEGLLTALEHGLEEIKTQPAEVLFVDVIKLDLPYIVMLSMAVLGIGIVTVTGEPTLLYWEVLTPVYCAICIYLGWRHADTREERVKLVWTQVLHWFAVLVAMWLVHSDLVRDVVNNNATGLNLMTILALATFIAGVHAEAWQICIVGAVLALCVPAMAFIQQSALFMLVAVGGLVLVGAMLWATTHAQRRKVSQSA